MTKNTDVRLVICTDGKKLIRLQYNGVVTVHVDNNDYLGRAVPVPEYILSYIEKSNDTRPLVDFVEDWESLVSTPLVGVPDPNPQMYQQDEPAVGPVEQEDNTSEDSPYRYIRTEVLAEASNLVTGRRQADYGTPQENMDRIATMFQILFPEREWKASDIPLALLAVKFGRSCQGYTRDTAVDMAGYASLWAEVSEVEE